MAHTRIRKFNTKDTYPEQKLDNDLCQAVVTRGCTHSAGEQCRRVRCTMQLLTLKLGSPVAVHRQV